MGTGPVTDPPPTGPGRALWDKHELAAFFGVPVGTITKAITKRQCPRITWIGRHARFDPADVMAYVEQQKEKAPTVKPATPPALELVPPAVRKRVAA